MDSVRKGWTREWKIVGAMSVGWQSHEGRDRRDASVRLGARDVEVTINRVRMRSRGARMRPVVMAAAAATHSDAQGYGEAMSTNRSTSSLTPKSGTFSSALRRLRPQFSNRVWSMEYRNVAFVPFHTPQTDSFAQSCAITSRIESGRRNII